MGARWTTESTPKTTNGLDELIKSNDGVNIGWAYKKSDAKLMSIAPELYSELTDARATIARLAEDYRHATGASELHPAHVEQLSRIDAALAKARGEQ